MLSAQLVHSWLKTLAANKEMFQFFRKTRSGTKSGNTKFASPFSLLQMHNSHPVFFRTSFNLFFFRQGRRDR